MDVLITIDGREAIPVRAIPLLTDWQVLSPDAIAKALAGDELWFPQFIALTAYQIQDGTCKAIPAKFWDRLLRPKIEALSARIKQEAPDGIGRARWLHESLCVLPASAFVWRDEFEDCFWRKYGPNGEVNRDVELDLSPFIPELEKQKLVMEGFEAYQEARRQVRDEFATSWHNGIKIDDCKDQIARWEKLEQTTGLTPSKAHKLMALRQELKQLLALVAPAGAVGQPAPQPPVEADSVLSSSRLMKRKSLIQELEHKWPSIQADLSEASRNGLKQAAYSEQHRAWDAEKAEVWAKSKGKIGGTTLPTPSWCHGPVTRHTIDN